MSNSSDFLSAHIPNFWNRKKYRVNRDARLRFVPTSKFYFHSQLRVKILMTLKKF